MMFFPYRVDLDLKRIPWVTLLVCVACISVFIQQLDSQQRYVSAVNEFCQHSLDRSTRLILKRFERVGLPGDCAWLFISIREAQDSQARMRELSSVASEPRIFADRNQERAYVYRELVSSFASFENLVPTNLTDEYSHDPLRIQIKQMFTSVLTHGSWSHLIFNLLFFYAFAASVELITGSLMYAVILLIMALSTNIAYTLVSGAGALPTVGLSGIVMGMMALLAVAVPAVRIRCFLWILLYFKVLRIPALLLALWYIGWDVYNIQADSGSSTNYIVHISGAFTGVFVGLFYWLTRGNYLRGLTADH